MGRAGRVAPRICSTLELRTHASSLTVSLPATSGSKPAPLSPPSPGTPGQVAPASVRPVLQAWPQDALQVVQRQMEALRSHSLEASEPSTTRKRELDSFESREIDEISLNADGQGLEVALQTQPALPTDWEQFLDLKTGQFYYFHWSSCKRAKQDPRELVRQADRTVEAHMREAHVRGESSIEHIELATSPYDESDDESEAGDEVEERSGAGCCPPDVCERTSGICSVAPERCADRELGNDGSVCDSSKKEEQATSVCDKEGKSAQAVMVVSGCHSCSMFVMLCLSSPACPSCGAGARAERNGIR
ncbi:hypothetical protein M758_2G054400 [Ceratodon purpureus]|nr:hypothetical protein M758_2G054400 [Ceratodon purpureus]